MDDAQSLAAGASLERFRLAVNVGAFVIGEHDLDRGRGALDNHFGALDITGARDAELPGTVVHRRGSDARVEREGRRDDDSGEA